MMNLEDKENLMIACKLDYSEYKNIDKQIGILDKFKLGKKYNAWKDCKLAQIITNNAKDIDIDIIDQTKIRCRQVDWELQAEKNKALIPFIK